MSPKAKRALKSLLAGGAGSLIVAATVWAHVLWINGDVLTRGEYPLTPTLPVTGLSLFIDAMLPSLILLPPLALFAILSGPWPLRVLSVLMLLYGWYWVADRVASLFAPHFGATWFPGEPFSELFYRWPGTPALMGAAVLAYMLVLSRLNRTR
ncbi:hypothetical protein [Rhodalgimonas zhirmunskyi]|uniref:Uncharacterized protein n=1 Tax=Rhodalgimonas zhirmunskyi TaxID=2964767 RepID=A0AAJ1UGC5_9RHOB|nr:hypothetical protein [Rhodoalgimonas zhirmunskyi]MDQ2095402.1 hypothetical protein [Rhodoalgimonas zhirmunskyi]